MKYTNKVYVDKNTPLIHHLHDGHILSKSDGTIYGYIPFIYKWKDDSKLQVMTQREASQESDDVKDWAEDLIQKDEYHSMKELYKFRMMYNAALFNEWAKIIPHTISKKYKDGTEITAVYNQYLDGNKILYNVHKSWKHNDGEWCFGKEKEWFIVSAMLPSGLISNHYKAEYWDLFNIPEEEKALFKYDNHTSFDTLNRLEQLNKSK